MKNKKIIYKNSLKNKSSLKLSKNFDHLYKDIKFNLDIRRDNFHILSKNYKLNFKNKDLKKFQRFKNIAVIGMGGSILGAEAMFNFFENKIKKNFIFFDNIDTRSSNKLNNLKNLNQTLFIVISKSGQTIETLSNFLSLRKIKKNAKNIIVVSEKTKNPLYLLTKKMNWFHVEHKKYIGGRYSVLSEVGIITAILMGINYKKLRSIIRFYLKNENKKFLKESSIKLADLLLKNKYRNLIFLNYIPELEKFLYWSQQLIAESLGKKGKGFLPLVSNAPKDHHSLLQLYLDGPKDKLFYIFSSKLIDKKKLNTKSLDRKLKFLNKKSLSEIKIAQKNALIRSLAKKKIPYREFQINSLNEENLGELFSLFILETAIIGKLSKLNPFDQPAVEQVKIDTKKQLS